MCPATPISETQETTDEKRLFGQRGLGLDERVENVDVLGLGQLKLLAHRLIFGRVGQPPRLFELENCPLSCGDLRLVSLVHGLFNPFGPAPEPEVGIEPTTPALQERCSGR